MATTTRKIEFKGKDEKGNLLPAYEVLVDGESVGMVWKVRRRHDVISGRICVGWTYSTGWAWSTRIHDEFPTTSRKAPSGRYYQILPVRSRALAVEKLVAETAEVSK